MNKKETKDESNKGDLGEVEKLLAEFFINSSEEFVAFGEDLIEFSDESEDNSSDSGEYITDEEDDTNDSVAQNFESTSQKLKAQLTKILEDKSRSCTEISEFKSSAPQMNEFFTCQKSSRLFKIKDEKGSFVCSLCQWMPPESSCETFLAHCKTAAHRTKLKERFQLEQNQEDIPETTSFQDNKRTREICSKPETSENQKHSACSQEPLLKKQYENQTNQKSKGKEQKQLQSQQQPQAIDVLIKKKRSEKNNNKSSGGKKQTQKSLKVKGDKTNALKTSALAKSMAYIQFLSEQELICKMCSKIIPKALDTSTSIKNVSHHLQSKGHLKKVLEIENSLRKSLEKNDEKKKNDNTKKKNSNKKNTEGKKILTNVPKVEISKGDLPKNAAQLSKKQTISNQKKVSESKTVRSNLQKEKTDKKKLCSDTTDLKTGYICLACKSDFQSYEVLQTHMNSKTHLNHLNNKKTKAVSALDNLHKCNSCNLWLTGTLFDINKHYAECLKRKN